MTATATYQGVIVKGPMDLLCIIENTLGWYPATGQKDRIRHAGILKRKIASNPKLYTWHNLLLAVEFCRRKHITIRTPSGVLCYVDKALRIAAETPVQTADVETAIAVELERKQPEWQTWVRRLDRARGPERQAVLREWTATRAAA